MMAFAPPCRISVFQDLYAYAPVSPRPIRCGGVANRGPDGCLGLLSVDDWYSCVALFDFASIKISWQDLNVNYQMLSWLLGSLVLVTVLHYW